jgi:hypothetical protein
MSGDRLERFGDDFADVPRLYVSPKLGVTWIDPIAVRSGFHPGDVRECKPTQ